VEKVLLWPIAWFLCHWVSTVGPWGIVLSQIVLFSEMLKFSEIIFLKGNSVCEGK
jgi:hypothetical protein